MGTVAKTEAELPCPHCGGNLAEAFPLMAVFEAEMQRLYVVGRQHHKERRARKKDPEGFEAAWLREHFGVSSAKQLTKAKARGALELLMAGQVHPDEFNRVLKELRRQGICLPEKE